MNKEKLLRLQRIEFYFLLISALLPATLVAVFLLGRWPDYWKWIASEQTPMTSLEVTVMYSTALVSWGAGARNYLNNLTQDYKRWIILGLGFLWFAMDDRFAIHERIRDQIFIPSHITIPLLPIGPGDFILLIYMAIGLALLPWINTAFKSSPKVHFRFLAGVIVAAIAVLMDAYEMHHYSIDIQRLEQTIEECLELTSQILFLQATFLASTFELRQADLSI